MYEGKSHTLFAKYAVPQMIQKQDILLQVGMQIVLSRLNSISIQN